MDHEAADTLTRSHQMQERSSTARSREQRSWSSGVGRAESGREWLTVRVVAHLRADEPGLDHSAMDRVSGAGADNLAFGCEHCQSADRSGVGLDGEYLEPFCKAGRERGFPP